MVHGKEIEADGTRERNELKLWNRASEPVVGVALKQGFFH